MAGQKVAILGGGVAGLTAAHELSERGFSVEIYEQANVLGGSGCRRR
jgi:15-cis-phytoene desaturase